MAQLQPTAAAPTVDAPTEADAETLLVARLQAGDEAAFDDLMCRFQEPLLGFVGRLLGDADEAADVVQDSFIGVWQRIARFRGGAGIYTWLYRIAYNHALTRLRRRHLHRFLRLDRDGVDAEGGLHLQLVAAGDPASDLERVELLRHVGRAIETLPPRQRGIFVMRHYQGLSHAGIARIVGRSEGAIRASYYHAVRKLRDAARQAGLLELQEETP